MRDVFFKSCIMNRPVAIRIGGGKLLIKQLLRLLVVLLFVAQVQAANSTKINLPAFPGAEGFGALATGGRDGDIVHVTNLTDAGPGSFREAVSHSKRLVIFDVGGVIRLKSNVSCSSDVTILGQTAPGDGIAVYGRSISFSGCSNVIVRYMRFREGIGGDRGKCSVNIAGGSNMIFDHVSIEWGRWDCLGVTQGSHDITIQHCLVGQGIAPQCFGALVDSVNNVTLSHNLWMDNKSRNPKAKGTIQYINNVVYNWGVNGLVGGHSEARHELDAIGNYFIKGPSSNDQFTGMFTATDHVFQKDNVVDLDRNGQLDGRVISDAEFKASAGSPIFASTPFLHPLIPVSVDSPVVAWKTVMAGAGCSRSRDGVDQRLIKELSSLGSQGQLIRDEKEAGGMLELKSGEPVVSTARDGISDNWKLAHHLDLKDTNVATGDYNGDGYINLEKFANDLL